MESVNLKKERYEDKVMRYLRENNYRIFMIDDLLEYYEIPKYKRIYFIGAIKKMIYESKLEQIDDIERIQKGKNRKYIHHKYVYIGKIEIEE
jgi:hypothetical protein